MKLLRISLFAALLLGVVFGQQWQMVPYINQAKKVAVDYATKKIWALNVDSKVYYFEETRWVEFPGIRLAKELTVHNGTPYAIDANDGNIYYGTPVGWKKLSGALPGSGFTKRIAVDPSNGKLWQIASDDRVYKYEGGKWIKYESNKPALDLAVYKDVPYIIASDYNIWIGTGDGFQMMAGSTKSKCIAIDHATGKIWTTNLSDMVTKVTDAGPVQVEPAMKAMDIYISRGLTYAVGMKNQVYVLK